MKVVVRHIDGEIKKESHNLFNKFVEYLHKEYPLEKDIEIQFLAHKKGHMSTGSDTDKHLIKILTKNRLNRDILRTLAHEWIHEYQKQISKTKGELKREDEANMIAGRLLKSFEKKYPKTKPQIYEFGMKNLVNRMHLIENTLIEDKKNENKKFFLSEMKKIGIEKLPYSYTSLKSFIDPETMDVHYNKHYKGYVEKLNLALQKRKLGDLELEDIIRTISKYSKSVRDNAGGAFNHALFWKMLSPKPVKLSSKMNEKLDKNFGSFKEFKKEFETKAKERFGSGWVWLVLTKNNTLKIMTTPNQDNPLMNIIENGGYPILGLDLWEHAYYLKYKNRRDVYIKNFWKVVNWDFVEKLYDMKQDTKKEEEKIIKEIFQRD